MARVSIYVSDELKSQMTPLNDVLNWSDIARPAFEQAISNHNSRKELFMSGLERLKASKQEYFDHVEKSATKEGRLWASDKATFYELRAVSGINLSHYEEDNSGITNRLYHVLNEYDQLPYDFWIDSFFSIAGVSDDWSFNFVKGAQEFYDEVKDQL